MKVIIDPKLTERIESVQLHPNRLFYCARCHSNYKRNSVKKVQGNYYCLSCGQPVEDISDTDAGQELAGILGL